MPNIKLLNIDCMKYMATVPDKYFDLAIVDPPYGIGINEQFKKATNSSSSMFNKTKGCSKNGEWDASTPPKEYFVELFRVSKNQIIWGGNYFIEHLKNTRCFISWDKNNGDNNMADFELAWTSFDKSCRRFVMHHFSHGYGEKIHICQKPVKLYDWLLANYAKPEFKILDTHLGSASSAIAAHYFGVSEFVGTELDEDYFNAAKARFERETAQIAMF